MRSMHTRRSAWIIALAIAAAAPASVALGIAKVGDVRVAGTAAGTGGGEVFTAPEGTESVFALFEYTGASRSDITVRVIANGIEVFKETTRYDGAGTAAVEITGELIYETTLETMDTVAREIKRSTEDLTDEDDLTASQAYQAVTAIESGTNNLLNGLQILESLEISGTGAEALQDLSDAIEATVDEVNRANALPYEDIQGRRVVGEEIAPHADEILVALASLEDAVSESSGLALPTTGTDWEFDVSVRTATASGSTAAGSARFMVTGTTARGEDEPDEPTARPSATSRGNAASDAARGAGTPTSRAQATAAQGASGSSSGAPNATDRPGSLGAANASATEAAGADAIEPPDDVVVSTAPAEGVDGAALDADDASGGEPIAMSDSAQPTWTVPAGRAADSGSDVPESTTGQAEEAAVPGRGPNLAVLGIGLALLLGVALWFRRRG